MRSGWELTTEYSGNEVSTLGIGGVSQDITRQYGQAQGIVEFAVGEQAGVGCDPRTVELQLQPSVETGPKWAATRFTLRVPHPSHLHLI